MTEDKLEEAMEIKGELDGLKTALKGLTSRRDSDLKKVSFDFQGISNGKDIEKRHVGEETMKDIMSHTIYFLQQRKQYLKQRLKEL